MYNKGLWFLVIPNVHAFLKHFACLKLLCKKILICAMLATLPSTCTTKAKNSNSNLSKTC